MDPNKRVIKRLCTVMSVVLDTLPPYLTCPNI